MREYCTVNIVNRMVDENELIEAMGKEEQHREQQVLFHYVIVVR